MEPMKETDFLVSEPLVPFTAFINKNIGKKTHWHDYIELLYVISGNSLITIEGQKYDVFFDDFLIINSQESHSSEFYNDKNSEILVIQFEPFVINPNFNSIIESKYMIPFLQHEVVYDKIIKLSNHSDLKLLLNEILQEFNNKRIGYELNIKGDIYKIFSWLIRNSFNNVLCDLGIRSSNLLRLKSLFKHVDENYKEHLSSQWAASFVCMSYYHFCRFFRKTTNKTFIEYLNFVRLHEAEKLLIYTINSISEIAFNTGFSSVSYFNRFFKKEKGISPLNYRKQICSENKQK